MSSARARSRQKRQARPTIRCCQRRTMPSKAPASPASTRAASAASSSSALPIRPFFAIGRGAGPRPLHFLASWRRGRKRNRPRATRQIGEPRGTAIGLSWPVRVLAAASMPCSPISAAADRRPSVSASRRRTRARSLAEQPGDDAEQGPTCCAAEERRPSQGAGPLPITPLLPPGWNLMGASSGSKRDHGRKHCIPLLIGLETGLFGPAEVASHGANRGGMAMSDFWPDIHVPVRGVRGDVRLHQSSPPGWAAGPASSRRATASRCSRRWPSNRARTRGW